MHYTKNATLSPYPFCGYGSVAAV